MQALMPCSPIILDLKTDLPSNKIKKNPQIQKFEIGSELCFVPSPLLSSFSLSSFPAEPSDLHDMACKYALRTSSVSAVLNLAFTIAAFEAGCTEGLISCDDREILNLVPTGTAVVCAIVTD